MYLKWINAYVAGEGGATNWTNEHECFLPQIARMNTDFFALQKMNIRSIGINQRHPCSHPTSRN
jgi:hypothetical protein